MKKNIIIIFTLYLFLSSCSTKNNEIEWTIFRWVCHTDQNGKTYEKAAIIFPVEIDNLPHKFTAQLDLGATVTTFDASMLEPYLHHYPELKRKVNYKSTMFHHDRVSPLMHNIKIKIGNNTFKSKLNVLRRENEWNLPLDSIFSLTEKHIATVGANLFENKILIIDYPNERFSILKNLPESIMSQIEFTKIKYTSGSNRILIPFFIGGEKKDILFDTGSSLFSLTTSKKNLSLLADTTQPIDTMCVNSWGKMIYMYGYKILSPVYLGNYKMDSSLVYVAQDEGFEKAFESGEWGWGIAGNKYFLDNTIIIDFKNKQFGIVKGDLP